jgi:hypothetical protein
MANARVLGVCRCDFDNRMVLTGMAVAKPSRHDMKSGG